MSVFKPQKQTMIQKIMPLAVRNCLDQSNQWTCVQSKSSLTKRILVVSCGRPKRITYMSKRSCMCVCIYLTYR